MTKPITLSQISYPVFLLGNEKPTIIDGVVLYAHQYLLEDNTEKMTVRIVDDRSLSGKTLAKRRLDLLSQGVPLKRISKAIFFLGDLIKLAKPTMWFMDSNGEVFRYTKHKRVKLIHRKIVGKHIIPSGGAIIEVEGIATRFKMLFAPRNNEQYAGILEIWPSYVLYGVYENKQKDSWRMV